MLKVNISNVNDTDEAVKLRKRQQFEDERKQRIFNAQKRLFGIDTDTIERQVAEKKKRKHIETECKRRYEEQIRIQDQALIAKDKEQELRQRMLDSDMNFYRCRFQRKHHRREFDLNDPNALKKAKPLRIADDDTDLGLASCQIFAGEDLGFHERRKRQFEQQRAWLDQQVMERKRAEKAKHAADEKWRINMMEREKQLEDMVVSEKRVRDQIRESIRLFNATLARDGRMAREREKQNTTEDNMAEIYNMLTSDMLTENPDVAISSIDPKKKIAFMYRGMTPHELTAFRKEQERLRLDSMQRKEQAKLMNTQWEQYALNMDRELRLKDIELAEREKKIIHDMVEFNAKLAREKELEKEASDRHLKGVGITDEFYNNFNTHTR